MTGKVIALDELVLSWPQLATRDEAARVLGAAGYAITSDELGRPSVSLVDAKRWVEAERVADAAAERRQEDFAQWKRDTDSWVRGRSDAAAAAARRARSSARGDSAKSMAARAASVAAAEDFERTVARPRFDDKPAAVLAYVSESEAATVGGRVKAAAKRLARLESVR